MATRLIVLVYSFSIIVVLIATAPIHQILDESSLLSRLPSEEEEEEEDADDEQVATLVASAASSSASSCTTSIASGTALCGNSYATPHPPELVGSAALLARALPGAAP